MTAVGAVNLGVRFALELAMLAAFACWGFVMGDSVLARVLLGIGAPILAIIAWGVFVAPKAERRLTDPARVTVEVVLFALASVALVSAGLPVLGGALSVLAAVNIAMVFALDQR